MRVHTQVNAVDGVLLLRSRNQGRQTIGGCGLAPSGIPCGKRKEGTMSKEYEIR